MKTRPLVAILLSAPLPALSATRLFAEDVDLATVHRIKAEAFQGSKVMDHLFWLTDVNGPRLTGSPGFRSAADWAVQNLKQWGAAGARLETWGTFGRGWSMSRFSAHMTAPTYVQSADLMQASAVLASFVYDAATRPDKLPRKPLPKPLPPKKTDKPAKAGG